ncbi:MAG: hypothetical protein IPK75_18980 [Acidobacteria bacterium]|nr:hypothetical protein [Acidobacteriota bacterium]
MTDKAAVTGERKHHFRSLDGSIIEITFQPGVPLEMEPETALLFDGLPDFIVEVAPDHVELEPDAEPDAEPDPEPDPEPDLAGVWVEDEPETAGDEPEPDAEPETARRRRGK